MSKQNSFLCGPLCMRVCLHGSECSIVHVSGWVCICLQMRDSESPGWGVINSSWPLGSVKLGGKLSLFLVLLLPGPLIVPFDLLRGWQRWRTGPAVSGQMPLIDCFSTGYDSPSRFYNTSAKNVNGTRYEWEYMEDRNSFYPLVIDWIIVKGVTYQNTVRPNASLLKTMPKELFGYYH